MECDGAIVARLLEQPDCLRPVHQPFVQRTPFRSPCRSFSIAGSVIGSDETHIFDTNHFEIIADNSQRQSEWLAIESLVSWIKIDSNIARVKVLNQVHCTSGIRPIKVAGMGMH